LQYAFCSMDFFLQLDIIISIVHNNLTWLISAPNINQSTFGIVIDGIISTPDINALLIVLKCTSLELESRFSPEY